MGRVRENASQTACCESRDSAVTVGVCTSNLLVTSYYSQKNELIWALATVTTNSTTSGIKTTNSSAEKKGAWNPKGQGLSRSGVCVFLYYWILKAKVN